MDNLKKNQKMINVNIDNLMLLSRTREWPTIINELLGLLNNPEDYLQTENGLRIQNEEEFIDYLRGHNIDID